MPKLNLIVNDVKAGSSYGYGYGGYGYSGYGGYGFEEKKGAFRKIKEIFSRS
jgi:hypothetical protein